MPLAHAAKAQAIVNPYAGAAGPKTTPRRPAVTAEACPTATMAESLTDSLMATDPFKFTNVAAVVQP